MSELEARVQYLVARPALRDRLVYQARILRVLARTDFKVKYAGSVLGYIWSVTKPLMYFTILWVVFRSIFRTGIHNYAMYLIIGLVLWTFVADAVTATLPSIVGRASVLRRIAFPPIVIPLAATVTALMTFAINLLVIVVFIVVAHVTPSPRWILLLPLLLELYLFVLGLGLVAAILHVRFRDVGQIWEVVSSLLFFTTPIMYQVTLLPGWLRPVVGCNPFVQVLQDCRRVVLGPDAHAVRLIGFHGNHVAPLAILFLLLACGAWLYRRESFRFAELA